jgi:hypothetical protein
MYCITPASVRDQAGMDTATSRSRGRFPAEGDTSITRWSIPVSNSGFQAFGRLASVGHDLKNYLRGVPVIIVRRNASGRISSQETAVPQPLPLNRSKRLFWQRLSR